MSVPKLLAVVCSAALATTALAAPTRTSPLAVAGDVVFAVNPDSNTVARLDFSGMGGTLTNEASVGAYPRTLTLAGSSVFVTNQRDDSVSRLDQATLANRADTPAGALGDGCNPFGVVATPDGGTLLVSCQGRSALVLLDLQLNVLGTVPLQWPNARAIAVSSDGTKAYVTHFLTEEPGSDGHVSVVDLANKSVATVFTIPADLTTCETQNSGGGVLNLLNSVVLLPDGAPPEVAGELWVGGVQQNNVTKGLFKRESTIKSMPGAALFPLLTFKSFPDNAIGRNKYRPSFHDIIRFGIVKMKASDGSVVGKLDIDEAAQATDMEISADGTVAFVVDQTFNSFHVFNTKKGQGTDVTTLFASPSALGPGGGDPSKPCSGEPLNSVTNEKPFRMSPQAQITTIDGYDPVRFDGATYQVVSTGADFDGAHYWATQQDRMRAIPDGIGTAPIGVRLSADGERAYILNYLARNVVVAGTNIPAGVGGKPEHLRCSGDATIACEKNDDCPAGVGFCNHPGGAPCTQDSDCGAQGPCIRGADCIPLLLEEPVSTITGGLAADPLPPSILDGKILFNTAARDASVVNNVGLGQGAPLMEHPDFGCHYDATIACGTPQGQSSFQCSFCANDDTKTCGSDADCGGARCVNTDLLPKFCTNNPSTACHVDRDCGAGGRCEPLKKYCSNDISHQCQADAECGPGGACIGHLRFCTNNPALDCASDGDCGAGTCQSANCDVPKTIPGAIVSTSHDASYVTCSTCHADYGGQDGRTWDFSQFGASLRNTMDLRGRAGFAPGHCSNAPDTECFFDAACGQGNTCKANEARIPPHIPAPDRDRWFNPMLTVHWNGDRDEVEDFEATFRQLQGSGDCDAAEDASTCQGALVQRSAFTSIELPRKNSSQSLPCPLGCQAECPQNCNDVEPDLGAPNRNLPGTAGHNVGYRLTHLADFVYSLTEFVKNPNPANESAERGRAIFNDTVVNCSGTCHNGGPGAGRQFFTDKAPNPSFDPAQPPRGDTNNPFVRHDVGTGNVFDGVDPNAIAKANQIFQNSRIPIPGTRGMLGDYVTPVLNDVWNTAPYLHDGSAHTLLDVVRPCNQQTEDCTAFGRGRNVHTQDGSGRHGTTDVLTPSQLNDLVAFQKSLTLETVVGTPTSVVRAGHMDVKKVVWTFPATKKGKTKPGAFAVAGLLHDAPGAVDASGGVTLELAFPDPDAGEMKILRVPFTTQGSRKVRGKASAAGGTLKLGLQPKKGGKLAFTVVGKKLDLSALDTGNQDLFVSLAIGDTTFTRNRYLTAKKGVLRLPKRGKKGKA